MDTSDPFVDLDEIFVVKKPASPECTNHDLLEHDDSPYRERREQNLPMNSSDLIFIDNYIYYCLHGNDDDEHIDMLRIEIDFAFSEAKCKDLRNFLTCFFPVQDFPNSMFHLAKVLKILYYDATIQQRFQMLEDICTEKEDPKSLICIALTYMRGNDLPRDLNKAMRILRSACDLMSAA